MLREELAPIRTRLDALGGEVAGLRTGVDGLRTEVAGFRTEVAGLRARVDTLGGELASMRAEVDGLRADMAAMRPNVEGIPLLQRAISTIHQEQRMMKIAINEMARAQFTSAEVEALHSDVNSVQATHLELETRILTLEREVKETKNALAALKQR
jgi:predicted  nucleic acid-binding Zn-ribbon protein